MKIRFKKLEKEAVSPFKKHSTDAGWDLTAISMEFEKENIVYHTGIAVEIPDGYVGLIFPRSSVCKKDLLLSNSVGVIDSNYRGEILLKFKHAPTDNDKLLNFYNIGERIGQLIVIPYPEIEWEEADELSQTDRGEGGYGSTGK